MAWIEGKSRFKTTTMAYLVENQEHSISSSQYLRRKPLFWYKQSNNSMQGEWVPAMAQRAKRVGMRVSGHVPLFLNAECR